MTRTGKQGMQMDCGDLGCDDLPQVAAPSLKQILAIEASERVVVEGTLEKRGYWNPSWKSRYFVLDSKGHLCYYKSREDIDAGKSPSGRIAITRCCSVLTKVSVEADKFCFDVHIPANGHNRDRTFQLCASSAESMKVWVDAIEDVRQRIFYVTFEKGGSWWGQ
eukprot:CAMPEP_0113683664 /NCGR_PEP_ID=MMETSP0038_2-20120614/13475_1 /TAXON_ID=2898 /ORGANISM="Cryptomonas paramecium" /LENGTH=163 /DNA_ID=CAMNT_0000603131 /DNA_START=63 /DNA_END=554 /DNA_ORIENTATION=+ /assembly_acc=CAM_ASM_000170